MKVMIAESSYPRDFYSRALDGNSVAGLLATIRVEHELRYVLDMEHLEKCIEEACENEFDILHLSTHGDEKGIALADNSCPSWKDFASLFSRVENCPIALVMSACCGAASGIGEAFQKIDGGPTIIFGSTEPRSFSEYATAWSILYHNFKVDGVTRAAAQTALQQITAVVHRSFLYRRWDQGRKRYLQFPAKGVTYEIVKTQVPDERVQKSTVSAQRGNTGAARR